MVCLFLVGGEFLPQMEEVKYLGVLFMSERQIKKRGKGELAVELLLLHTEKNQLR